MLKITASLLNSWNYLWQVDEEYQENAMQDLVNYLHRIKTPTNEAMQRGIDFEALAIMGQVPIISDLIKDGQFQVYAEKTYMIDGLEFKLLGYLDVLKAGVIYDIKRNTKYEFPKYEESYQHWCYFALVPEAYEFRYLVGAGYTPEAYNDTVTIHTSEVYHNDGQADFRIITAIRQFISWLKVQGLYDVYVKNYTLEEK